MSYSQLDRLEPRLAFSAAPTSIDGHTIDLRVDGHDLRMTLINGRVDLAEGKDHEDATYYYTRVSKNKSIGHLVIGGANFTLDFKDRSGGKFELDGDDGGEGHGKFKMKMIDGRGDVTGMVYHDSNENGVRDRRTRVVGSGPSEDGVAGATVYADLNNNERYDRREPRAFTDADGRYTITGIKAGYDKTVRCQAPRKWTLAGDDAATFDVVVGTTDKKADFAVIRAGQPKKVTITGMAFYDHDADGKFDPVRDPDKEGEAFSSFSSPKTVFADLNRNGVPDEGEPTAKTDDTGHYALTPACRPARKSASGGRAA